MKRVWLAATAMCFLGFVSPVALVSGQTHSVKKPETVVRAVAVYEYTGEEGKATASRVVPVSLFINGTLRDAGIYLARPVPFALSTGTIYEAQKSGVPSGTVELAYDRHLTAGDTEQIDDGWLAYGPFKPRPAEIAPAKKQSGPLPKVEVAGGSRPHFGSRPEGTKQASAGTTTGDDSTAKTDDAKDGPRPDPDRPSFHKAPQATAPDPDQKKTDTADPNDEAERPTLKRRTPAEIKADQKKKDSAKVTGGNGLNDDPDRPNLHRGKPASRLEEADLPPLRGIPKDMKQVVTVSDAKDRAEHDFSRAWENEAEHAEVLGKMQAFARAKLAVYLAGATAPSAADAAAEKPRPMLATHTAPANTPAARAAARRKAAAAAAAAAKQAVTEAAAPVLTDEVLKGYTLSYGGDPTFFYTATSRGADAVTRYVSVVAQQDPITGLKVALSSVTDSTHLDRTPWLRLVDVVDADASNRASLLMELRAQRTRQFALYRVIGAQAEQVFATGSTE